MIALVVSKRDAEKRFTAIGVRDSKLLRPKRREELYGQIKKLSLEVKVDCIEPGEINEAMRRRISLNELEAIHFAKLFDQVENEVGAFYLDSPDVIAEKFGVRVNMSSARAARVNGIKADRPNAGRATRIVSEHKADSRYPIVSAASIIAKVTRDREMRKIEHKLGIKIGSGYPSDFSTVDAVREHMNESAFLEHLREYWSTMDNIRQTRITSFVRPH
ncbi:MAG: ribonuclease HII [Candidatus Marsarchaeota archaeon]|nr:ribonuclease HII [Candidatus Marsarchaeota archaeon]